LDADSALLPLLIEDGRKAPTIYQPNAAMAEILTSARAEVASLGLRDFRRRGNSTLARLAATDILTPDIFANPFFPIQAGDENSRAAFDQFAKFTNDTLRAGGAILPWLTSLQDLFEAAWRLADLYGRSRGAAPLASAGDCLIGNPDGVFEIGGKPYTMDVLARYMRYAYACAFIDFGKISTYAELGPGHGKKAAMIKAFHPHLTILLFDLDLPIYITERFMSAAFPGDVVSYRKTREWTDLDRLEPGKVHCFGAWQTPLLKAAPVDLFASIASLQEMGRDVAGHYLDQANDAKAIYLCQAPRPGMDISVYREALAGFDLLSIDQAYWPLRRIAGDYMDSVWRKHGAIQPETQPAAA